MTTEERALLILTSYAASLNLDPDGGADREIAINIRTLAAAIIDGDPHLSVLFGTCLGIKTPAQPE